MMNEKHKAISGIETRKGGSEEGTEKREDEGEQDEISGVIDAISWLFDFDELAFEAIEDGIEIIDEFLRVTALISLTTCLNSDILKELEVCRELHSLPEKSVIFLNTNKAIFVIANEDRIDTDFIIDRGFYTL